MQNFASLFLPVLKHPITTGLRYVQLPIAVVIFFYAALMPASDAPSQWPDGALHLMGNLLLVCSIYTAAVFHLSLRRQLIVCIILSVTSELAQLYSHTRVFDLYDLAVNILGLTTGFLLCAGVNFILKISNHKTPL